MTILAAEHLVKAYQRGPERVVALNNAHFTLGAGELVALVGPSGSGKTTLLNLIAGWEDPDSGQVTWCPQPDARMDRLGWVDLAIVPQRLGLVEELSVEENVGLPFRFGPPADDDGAAAVATWLERFGLSDLAPRLPFEASLGEQQRTALARALVRRPRLLLADEPTGHQDEGWASGVLAALRTACDEGTTVLMATHDTEHLALVDRVLRIEDGHLTSA
jgi:putative ABC transport system ATP-binding protein